jgi:hypothetical protein
MEEAVAMRLDDGAIRISLEADKSAGTEERLAQV